MRYVIIALLVLTGCAGPSYKISTESDSFPMPMCIENPIFCDQASI